MKYRLVNNNTGEIIAESNEYIEPTEPFQVVFVKCDICGEYDVDAFITTFNDQIYCDNCTNEYLCWCDKCGCLHDKDDVRLVHNGWRNDEYWCEQCIDDNAFTCNDCGELYSYDKYDYYVVHGNYYCENCSDYIYYCENCNEYYFDDEGCYNEDNDCWYCDACYNEICNDTTHIRSYHSRPAMQYYGAPAENFKGFGIELEIDTQLYDRQAQEEALDALNNALGDHVYFNHDGSLNNGFEIITQPHTREALTGLDWKTPLEKLVRLGYRSHDIKTCGLHMHVSRAMFGDDEVERTQNIAKIIQFYALYWNDILKFSRRTQQQADRWARNYINGVDIATSKDLVGKNGRENDMDYSARYHAVNLQNRNTIEFRLMRGTLNHNTFMATLDFLMTVAENAKSVTNVTSLNQWFKGLNKATKEYMKQRKCFGYNNNQPNNNEQGDEE